MIKNNVTRFLDGKKVAYEIFELPAEKISAVDTADLLGVDIDLVYKSIVLKREGKGKSILAVIPGPKSVDLKAVAKALGEKKVLLTTQAEAEKITRLQAGGISPLALINKGFEMVIDADAECHDKVHVSGGQRGLNIKLATKDLAALTNAKFAPISKEE
jgi:Cys-tRNA(Pro)/Cys-tRNA(Cys) deacylase